MARPSENSAAQTAARAAKTAAIASATAAVAAIASLLRSPSGAAAQTPPGQFPPEVLQALAAIAQTDLAILEQLQALSAGGALAIQGYPKNADTFDVEHVPCLVAGKAYPVPTMNVRDGFRIWFDAPTSNKKTVYVGPTQGESTNPQLSRPLVPGQGFGLYLKTSVGLYVSADSAGDEVVVTVEQDK